jgi:serine protease Do
MNKKQFFAGILLAAFLGAIIALGGYSYFVKPQLPSLQPEAKTTNFKLSSYSLDSSVAIPEGLNFVYAAEKVRPTVVHIKTTYTGSGAQGNQNYSNPFDDLFRDFFEDGQGGGSNPRRLQPSPQKASGSGVILSHDGYIITNNHVIDEADKIEVVLDDKRRYFAKVIGTDPSTDLALIKIEEKDLPYATFGNSDNLKIGEWVLAIGNPFNLTSTVTAGIVSALSRNIDIIRREDNSGIEAFIQTDAAVNPGNSGGALVDLRGNLIGINTAILGGYSGSYTGYSFAIPSVLARKVMDDLLKYGAVQRGLLGIQIRDIDPDFAEENKLSRNDGVYVIEPTSGGGAEEAGIKKGDIVIKVDNKAIHTVSQLQQSVAIHRPGDKVKVTVLRDGKEKDLTITLKNSSGNTQLVKKTEATSNSLGADLVEITSQDKTKLKLNYGVKVNGLKDGIFEEAGVKQGFVITKVQSRPVKTGKEVESIIRNSSGRVLIEGVYPNGEEGYYVLQVK